MTKKTTVVTGTLRVKTHSETTFANLVYKNLISINNDQRNSEKNKQQEMSISSAY